MLKVKITHNSDALIAREGENPRWHFTQEATKCDRDFLTFANKIIACVSDLPMVAVLSFYNPIDRKWMIANSHVFFVNCFPGDITNSGQTLGDAVSECFRTLANRGLTLNAVFRFLLDEDRRCETPRHIVEKTIALRFDYVASRHFWITIDDASCKASRQSPDRIVNFDNIPNFNLSGYINITGNFINSFLHAHPHKEGLAFPLLRSGELFGVFFLYTPVTHSLEQIENIALYLKPIYDVRFQLFFNETRDLYFENARHAATAAIMSRNMSHNLGSHALANSRFFESVGLLNETADKQVSDKEFQGARSRLQAFNQYCQQRLDFIARKLSEDGDKPEPLFFIGDVIWGFATQDVLLNTLLDDNGFRRDNIEIWLHGFNYGKDRSEEAGTVWKWTKTRSLGWQHKIETMRGKGGNDLPHLEDFLVGIVGGSTGCHALYAIFENLLRNAAKYSKRTWNTEPPVLRLHIEVARAKDAAGTECYRLRLWENLTDDTASWQPGQKPPAVVSARHGLFKGVIDEDGQPVRGGHGMQEMKFCAEYLAGGMLRFPSDDEQTKDDPDGREYLDFLETPEAKPLDAGAGVSDAVHPVRLNQPALRAFRMNIEERKALVYSMLLPMPELIGIVCARSLNGSAGYGHLCETENPGVKRYGSIEELARHNPHTGVILAHDAHDATIRMVLSDMAENERHNSLPYRLIIVTRERNDFKKWSRAVEAAQADGYGDKRRLYPVNDAERTNAVNDFRDKWTQNENWQGTPILPYRRVHVIEDIGFFKEDATCEHLSKISREEWENIFLDIYSAWILAWRGLPANDSKRWKLYIGFERDPGQIASRWESPLRSFADSVRAKRNKLFDLYIGAKLASQDGAHADGRLMQVQGGEFSNGAIPQNISDTISTNASTSIVFDNHGKAFGLSDQVALSVHRYHSFSGNEASLYQMLETPPASPFGFHFFLLSILEACLSRIYTLDERVCEATLPQPDFTVKGVIGKFQAAGIYPFYSFAKIDKDNSTSNNDPPPSIDQARNTFVTPNILSWLHKLLTDEIPSNRNTACAILSKEGIRIFGKTGARAVLSCMKSHQGCLQVMEITGSNYPDAVIIHEGITDSLDRNGMWKKGDHRHLFSVTPCVVRTSGRGRASREIGDELPFIELSVLSDSTYGSLNKIKLARAVLSASSPGNRKDERTRTASDE